MYSKIAKRRQIILVYPQPEVWREVWAFYFDRQEVRDCYHCKQQNRIGMHQLYQVQHMTF